MMYAEHYLKAISACLAGCEATLGATPVSLQEGLDAAVELLKATQSRSGTQLFLGNGASAAFAEHMALDWTKNGGILSHSPSSWVLLTALSNDIAYEHGFSHVVEKYLKPEDVVVTISSSGNSPNIVNAIAKARDVGCKILTLSGLKPDNKSRQSGDINFYVPAKTYGIVECCHQVLLHMILDSFMNIKEWDRADYQNMNCQGFQL